MNRLRVSVVSLLVALIAPLIAHGASVGDWIIEHKMDPVDDSPEVGLLLRAASGTSRLGEAIYLVISCRRDTTDLFIIWNDYLGTEADVLTRVGTAPAATARWTLSGNSQGTFYPGKAIPFIKTLVTANQLVARVTPYGENPVTAVFKLDGIKEAITPLQETCHWR